nr:hypothetical protein [Tanacetum cinerariifolium]
MHKAFPLLEESSHWQYNFPLPVEGVPTARRMEIPWLKSLHCYDETASQRELAVTLRRWLIRSIKFREGLLGIKCTRHSHCQVKCSHWQYKFPLPVKVVATARRLEMPLPEVCTAIEEKKKKLPVKDRWQLH